MKILAVSHACIVDINQRLFQALEALGHKTTIIVPSQWPDQYSGMVRRPKRLSDFRGDIVVRDVWKAGSVALHGYWARPRTIINDVKPDVIYIEEEPYSLAAFQWAVAARRMNVPSVFYSAQNLAKKYPFPFGWIERTVWESTNGAAVVSTEVGTTLRKRGYLGSIDLVPLSVDLTRFQPMQKDGTLADALAINSPIVGFFGRLVPAKGIHILLEALELMQRRIKASLLVVGNGPLAETCRTVPGVTVVNGVRHTDVPKYLSLCEVVAVPSVTTRYWKEQFGRVIVEALACAIPVVGSSSGEIPLLISSTGGGLVVPEGDARALAGALEKLLEDNHLRLRLGKRGRIAAGRYSAQRVATELETALEDAMQHTTRVTDRNWGPTL